MTLQDLRYAIRMLLRSPGFTLVVVSVLALGSGANSAVFSVLNAVVLRPLPYSSPDRVYEIGGMTSYGPEWFSAPDMNTWRERSQVFEKMAAVKYTKRILSGVDEPEQLFGDAVSTECFPLLGTAPILGRLFSEEDFKTGAAPVILIGQRLWQRRFHGDPNLLGRHVLLDGVGHIVIGIMPSEFQFTGKDFEFWVPLLFSNEELGRRDWPSFAVFARANRGSSVQKVATEADMITHALVQQYPKEHRDWRATVKQVRESAVGEARPTLLLLLGAVAFVLMIACLNVANLLMTRGMERSKEIAIRMALGAGRRRIVQQLFTESLLLALIGGSLGLVLAGWANRWLIALFADRAGLPRLEQTGIDVRVLGFTLCLCVLSSLVFGLIPALLASKIDFNEALKETGRSGSGGTRSCRLRNLIIIAETGLSLLLLIGAGLMLRSLNNLFRVNPGFNVQSILTARLPLPAYRIPDEKRRPAYYLEILRRVQALPGVRSAGLTTVLPLTGAEATITITSDRDPEEHTFDAAFRAVSPDYFRAMGIPAVLGRVFTDADTADSPRVAVVNEALARKMWHGENPVGKTLKWGKGVEIVGVVRDIKHKGLDAAPQPELFLHYMQYLGEPESAIVVRTDSSPGSVVAAMRKSIREFEPDQPIIDVRTMEHVVYDSLAQPRFYTLLLGIFSALALILASAGIYGVMSYSVSQRQHEIGIRMALGAQNRDIVVQFMRRWLLYVVIGIAVGLGAALGLTRLLSTMLYEVKQTDPLTYAGTSLFLFFWTAVATLIPMRRIMKVDPVVALRYE